jgi:hypothetical protein
MRSMQKQFDSWEPSQHSRLDTGKPRKTCAEVAARSNFRILTSSQQSEEWQIQLHSFVTSALDSSDNVTPRPLYPQVRTLLLIEWEGGLIAEPAQMF